MALSKCVDVSRSSVATRRPLDLLRAHWVELEDRVWADHITGKLFERKMISKRDKEKIEKKARRSRRKGAVLLLDMMMTSSWCACVEFAVILSETELSKDLGEKLLRDTGDAGVRDGGDRGTIVVENRRLKSENESLKKKVKRSEKKERGERVLRVGLEMEKRSDVTQYKWKQFEMKDGVTRFPSISINRVATLQQKVIAADWSSTELSIIDIHSSDVKCSTVDNRQNACGDRVESLFNAGDECFGTFYNGRRQQSMRIYRAEKEEWEHVTDIPSHDKLHYYGITADRDHVYIVGGEDDDGVVHDTILVYDINAGTQCDCKKMSSKKRDCSCTIIDNMLYVGGGRDEGRRLNSIECISLNDYSSHHRVAATPTYSCSLTTLCDRLVMLGGTVGDARNSPTSNMVSVLSPSLNSWFPLTAMNEGRYRHGTCTVGDDTLVVVGGVRIDLNVIPLLANFELLRFE
ncbi:uncharacterized protein LOC134194810 [Corticium candelabrum]|uniref:uncharacterized protein LOC134194810 n=1 Tax=Corticium candelabrum TaxID=121492 RepID=UPI002E2590C3|nr:uncharacterized protein LOC134194810 [Corticium candelabrum]